MRTSRSYKIAFLCSVAALFAACSEDAHEKNKEGGAKGTAIIETGSLAAVNTKAFVLTRYGYWYRMKIIGILEHGTLVNEGDSIIQLDPSEVNKLILDKETELETQLAVMETMQINQANSVSDLESKIKIEDAGFELKKIELEATRFESDRTKKIKGLEFEQAKINYAKEKRKLELIHIKNANDLKIQEIKINQIRADIESAKDILPKLTIRTPVAGVFQVGTTWTGITYKVGDEIYVGQSMGNVPELKWTKVNTSINENDFLKLKVGQKVNVRLDALPKVVFEGEVAYMGKLCHKLEQKSRQKVFDVQVNILKPDERLKPGMTVSCEFLTN